MPRIYISRPIFERFIEKVDVLGPDECWPWKASLDTHGYGQFWWKKEDGTWTMEKAPRVAWRLFHGPIPDGFDICHHCDNPACCNYERHLFAGTRAENLRDMSAKGRAKHSQFAPEQLADIRHRIAAGERQRVIAASLGVTQQTISNIAVRNRKSYA
jgi:HNH endonuclease